jgi:P-type Ca2+ transporter type 2C
LSAAYRAAVSPIETEPLASPHATDAARLCRQLDVESGVGLSTLAASSRLEVGGRNELTSPPAPSLLARFANQFRSLLILVLVGAAGLSAVVGEFKDAIIVAVVLLINATLGTFQEAKAEHSVRALQGMLPARARVRRGGRVAELAAAELVVGDVVLIEAGDRIPADARIVRATGLAADESSLTGETTPASKDADALVAADAPVAERATMVWMNSTVVRGRGEVVIVATGMATRIGQVARMLAETPDRKTPLQRQIDQLGRRLAMVAAVAVTAVFIVGLARGDTFAAAAMDAIALAIAAIPEGLPAVVTVTLALGTAAMARQRAIVKRLTSVETLGSTQVICTDKTGTLTCNQMTVRTLVLHGRRHTVTGEGYTTDGRIAPPVPVSGRALQAMVLCNDADVRDGQVVGDPTEGALLVLAGKAGLDVSEVRRCERFAELPFDATTKLMATVHAHEAGGTLLAVKGAPDVVLRSCTRIASDTGTDPLHEVDEVEVSISELAVQGLRTLGVATRHLPDLDPRGVTDVRALLHELTFEALVAIVDPPRPGVAGAVSLAQKAGIRVMMVTGDHPDTAAAIAREVGIDGEVVTGPDLDRLTDEQLQRRIGDIGVCARVAPEHKVRLVTALQATGLTTAMTGDGVNDAAALKRADIGIAMGIAGTEVTKEAADLVLADDDFTTIVTAVERGRGIYDNILSFVRFQLATNIGAIITILGARLIGLPAPFTPVQILWVNLIMDGPPALALGADPTHPDVMGRAPRDPGAPILDGPRLRRLLVSGTVMAAGTLAVFAWGLDVRPDDDGAFATTLAFTTFVLFQFVNAVNARVEHTSVFTRHTLRNGKLWLALAGVLALQILAVHNPVVGGIVDVVPLALEHWLLAAAVACVLLLVEEARKLLASALIRRATRSDQPLEFVHRSHER